jgi:hypothetical protein
MKRFPLLVCLILLFLLVVAGIPAAASPTISSVSPSSGPNNGVVTVRIIGSGFNSEHATVWLTPSNKCDPETKIYGTIKSRSENTMTATFSLNGKTPAPYTMWVNSPVTDPFGGGEIDDLGPLHAAFEIYKGTGTTYTTTTTTTTVTATVTTTATPGDGENSVFFETNPSGAKIFLNGNEVGTSTFTYYTNKAGVFDVVIKKDGCEDYAAKVSILEGKRVHFYAPLTQLASGSTTSVTTHASGTPAKTVTTIQKSTLKVPTPLGTFAPAAEESPVDPALALGAAGIAIGLVMFRRR